MSRIALLTTTGGGRQWHTVTPPHVTVNDPGHAPTGWFVSDFGVAWDFVGRHSAWVATTIANQSGTFLLSHTTDSGKRWTQARIQWPLSAYSWRGSRVLDVDIVNNRRGWLAVGPGATGPQFPMELWQTAKAAQSWHWVYATGAFLAARSPLRALTTDGFCFKHPRTTASCSHSDTGPPPATPGGRCPCRISHDSPTT